MPGIKGRLNPKRSEKAKLVAQKVMKVIESNGLLNHGKIEAEVGYSRATILSGEVRKMKSYQEEISPFLNKLIAERERVIAAMGQKDLTKVQYRDLAITVDRFTKNVELLSGRATEKVKYEYENLDDAQLNELIARRENRISEIDRREGEADEAKSLEVCETTPKTD